MNRPLTINIGQQQYVLPSIEGCLKDFDGKFHSAANALRLYEWLGGTEITPPILEAIRADEDGTFSHRRLGFKDTPIYPTQIQPGWLLEIEQLAAARVQMGELLQDNLQQVQEHSQGSEFGRALQETTSKVMTKLSMFSYFNANAMFQQTPIPERLCYEGLQVLDYLVQMVITQRDRMPILNDVEDQSDYPLNMFSKLELDRVIGSIHQAAMDGLFQDPEKLAKFYSMLDDQFYCECAMAFSFVTGVPIPVAYRRTPGKYYQWAKKVLLAERTAIPEMRVRPKPKNVVTLFKTK